MGTIAAAAASNASNQSSARGNEVHIGNVVLTKPPLSLSGKATLRAPEWIVRIGGGGGVAAAGPSSITKSNLEGTLTNGSPIELNEYCELFDFHWEYSRETSGHVAAERFTSSAITHTEVSILIPAGSFTPILRRNLNNGTTISEIIILRIGNLSEMKALQKFTYTDCILTHATQHFDFFGLSFRFTIVTEENFDFDQDDGTNKGQNACTVDYAASTVDGGGGGPAGV